MTPCATSAARLMKFPDTSEYVTVVVLTRIIPIRGSFSEPSWTPSPRSPSQAFNPLLYVFLIKSRSVTTLAWPAMEAHSPELLIKDTFTWGSLDRSLVLPDSVFVWKRRSMPPDSYWGLVSVTARFRVQIAILPFQPSPYSARPGCCGSTPQRSSTCQTCM